MPWEPIRGEFSTVSGGYRRTWLHQVLLDSLKSVMAGRPSPDELDQKPLNLVLQPPLPRRSRWYVYTATDPPGERSVGDFKIQLIVPGVEPGSRGSFDFTNTDAVFLVGYVPILDVFVLWDAGLHDDFPYSKNVQVHAATVHEAALHGQAEQLRAIRGRGQEVIVACRCKLLVPAISTRLLLTAERLASAS